MFSLDRAAGIVTFPSVHAAVAVLCIWATWNSRWLRYPFLFLNLAMIVSVVTHGSHYFVDAPAGIVLCLVCIKLAQVLPRILGWIPYGLHSRSPLRPFQPAWHRTVWANDAMDSHCRRYYSSDNQENAATVIR
ncbi:phosphatase PAP2 family protein [Aliirhizobium terrae]|uniref:phosphatase PAP2 family protein n=1 Tax=Terrirhizobium terrae TaxID=2926709 RepID=UPI002578A9FC|nr:phosphatase PAP2 family protein [Rhizobium sp. CC-CFT758]WJH40368.1 phosphatase PAP2 family protein [Rhizobium sp. CC-CFT758]